MAVMEITTKVGCHVRCSYCPQEKLLVNYKRRSNILQMSFETFKICIDKIPKEVFICFSGMCEPWLNPSCTKMLLYAHKKGHKIIVYTTLEGMSMTDIGQVENIIFDAFIVHLPSDNGYENIHVGEKYLHVLDRIRRSRIKVNYQFHGEALHPRVRLLLDKEIVRQEQRHTRAGNIAIKNQPLPKKHRGSIECVRKMRYNVLLPNGDVILCCMDYSMRHILGNLLFLDYASLFKSKEYLNIKKGMRDARSDILCRYCDMYTCETKSFYRNIRNFLLAPITK